VQINQLLSALGRIAGSKTWLSRGSGAVVRSPLAVTLHYSPLYDV
jgi:hypothetical protein